MDVTAGYAQVIKDDLLEVIKKNHCPFITAVHMLKNGTDIRYIQEMLGHASFHTSYQYTRVRIDHLKRMYREYHPFENQLYEDVRKNNEKYLKQILKEK
jgi:site-specific recombinase XerC